MNLISKHKHLIPRALKDILKDQTKWVIDRYTWTKPEPWFVLVWRTFRYRLAGLSLPITQNEKNFLAYHNLHRMDRAFIIGNGPSLNKVDLTLLKDEITFGVNSIFLNQERMGFYPTYYVVEDKLVAEDRADQINKYKGPVKFFGNYLNYCLNHAEQTIWLNISCRYDEYPGFPNFSRNAARILWVGGTVTYICMQLAYYMGIKKIYLIGFDHNYQIPADAILLEKTTEIMSQSEDPNHFDPSYFGKGYRWHDPRVDRMEKAYKKAKKIFEADGMFIYNATAGGKLELFPRVEYHSLFRTR